MVAWPHDRLLTIYAGGQVGNTQAIVHRGEITYPLRRSELLLMKTPQLAELGDVLLGLDEGGVRAVLVAVLAERRARRG